MIYEPKNLNQYSPKWIWAKNAPELRILIWVARSWTTAFMNSMAQHPNVACTKWLTDDNFRIKVYVTANELLNVKEN